MATIFFLATGVAACFYFWPSRESASTSHSATLGTNLENDLRESLAAWMTNYPENRKALLRDEDKDAAELPLAIQRWSLIDRGPHVYELHTGTVTVDVEVMSLLADRSTQLQQWTMTLKPDRPPGNGWRVARVKRRPTTQH